MKIKEFKKQIAQYYMEKIGGTCNVHVSEFLGSYHIYVQFFQATNKNQLTGGYWDNDHFKLQLSFELSELNENKNSGIIKHKNVNIPEFSLTGNYTLTKMQNYIFVKPQERFLAYSSIKIPFRKTTGDINKLVKTIYKFIDKLEIEIEKQKKLGNFLEVSQ